MQVNYTRSHSFRYHILALRESPSSYILIDSDRREGRSGLSVKLQHQLASLLLLHQRFYGWCTPGALRCSARITVHEFHTQVQQLLNLRLGFIVMSFSQF